MSLRDKIEHAIQNQPCMVKDLKAKFGGDRAADRKVMEALDELVHDAVVCQKSGVFFTARSGRAEKALLCKVVKLGKNFAFVMLEDESGDIFIPGRFTRGAMPGDSVLVEKFAHPRVEGSDEGEILAVLEQKNDMVGTARRIEGRLKFVPDDCPAISMTIQRDCGDPAARDPAGGSPRGRFHALWQLRGGQALCQGPALCQGHPHPLPREGAGRGKEVRGHDRV